MTFGELGVGGKNLFSRLPGPEFFENEVDRNPSSFQARLPHHFIRADLDVVRQFHKLQLYQRFLCTSRHR